MYVNYDIDVLEKVKFRKLERFVARFKTKDISIKVLEKVNFPELKELSLSNVDKTILDVLQNVKFERLEILNLLNYTMNKI